MHDIQSGYLSRNNNRDTNPAKGHRRRIGNQANPCSIHGVETQTHEHGCGNSHRSAEPGCTFNKRTKSKGDK